MADNTTITAGTTGDTIATDDLTTLNGGAVTGVKVQRVKVGFGVDGTQRDIDAANGLPIVTTDVGATGTLTAAAQTVVLSLSGQSAASVQLSGTWVGTITFEGSNDNGANWNSINAVAATTSYPQATTTVNGLYRLTPGGLMQMRVNMSAFTSGSATVSVRASTGTGGVFANQILPTKITDGTTNQGLRPDGYARVAQDPTSLLFDTFESLDTTNTWTTGGTAPTAATGTLTVNAGATASATSYLTSKPAFIPASNALLQTGDIVSLSASVQTGTKAIWGLGIIAGTPTAMLPLSNGAVFEVLDTDGLLYGAVYSNGNRTAQVALTRPTDGAMHRYSIYYKASRAYFELDNVMVGSIAFPNPAVGALGRVIGAFNGVTVLGVPFTLTASLLGVADTGKNSFKQADGLFPWRMQTVKAPSTAAVAADLPAVVTIHPSTFALPVTGTFFQATQPVSLATNTPTLQAGSTTAVTQATGTNLHVVVDAAPTTAVTGTFFQATQAVSATSLPLPAGASTETTLAALNTKVTAVNTGAVTISTALPTGTNALGSVMANQADILASGSITTQNLVPAGAATAGSAVEITLANASTLGIQVTGTYTGALSLQVTLDNANWITVGGTPFLNVNTGAFLATITSALTGIFQAETTGCIKARITALAAVTGTATLTLRATAAAALVALDTALPAGAAVIGAVTGSGNFSVQGPAGNGSVASGNPVQIAGVVSNVAGVAIGNGLVGRLRMTSDTQLLVKPYGLPETDWSYAGITGGIINTTDVVVKAAGAAGIRNYVTGCDVRNASGTVATEVVIKDGATTVLWRGQLPINSSMPPITFPTPLKGTAATAVNVACITTGAAVYVNLQGYQGA